MATTDVRPEEVVAARPSITTTETRKAKAVKWWAVVGGGFVALIIYMWTSWLVQGHAHAVPGRENIPTWMLVADRVQEGIVIAFLVAAIWYFGVKPWRKERRVTLDMLLIGAWLLTYMVQDPWENFTSITYSYNAGFFNLGCPQCHAPFWNSPNPQNFGEPLIFIGLMYPGVLFLGTVLACKVMDKAKARFAGIGTAGLMGICFGTMFLLDFLLEIPAMRFGGWVWWWAGPQWGTLFKGQYFQQPLLEAVAWGFCWGALACLRYFKNDKGQTVAERGIEKIKATPKQKTALRLLALVGAMNVIFFFCYTLPYQVFGLKASQTPDSICGKSYFNTGLAGPGTSYACPGPDTPMGRKHSVRITPDGKLYVPPGANLPDQKYSPYKSNPTDLCLVGDCSPSGNAPRGD